MGGTFSSPVPFFARQEANEKTRQKTQNPIPKRHDFWDMENLPIGWPLKVEGDIIISWAAVIALFRDTLYIRNETMSKLRFPDLFMTKRPDNLGMEQRPRRFSLPGAFFEGSRTDGREDCPEHAENE